MTVAQLHLAHESLGHIVAKYDGRAPRYTSYPTAVQFTDQVDAAVHRQWLRDLPLNQAISLYVHVPFCSRLCWFCGCNTRAVHRHEPVAEYLKYLERELDLLNDALPGRLPVQTLHLGGGTPNMLRPDDLERLLARLGESFELLPDLELAAELDPVSLTREWVMTAGALGLNRASLGVQNLSPTVQAAVNRHEDFGEVARCVGWLREAGVASTNLDLMYGLPHQTTANTLATLDQLLALRPERVALFGYAHVPWMKAHQALIDEKALPGAAERLDQSEAAAERLTAEGYVRIGIDHFALPTDEMAVAHAAGTLRRNFQGYTTDGAQTLIGLGASAISSLPQGFVQNITQELTWRAAIDRNEMPTARGVAVTEDDCFRADIIESLMCNLSVDLNTVCRTHGRTVGGLSAELERLAPFVEDGLLTIDSGRLQVRERGRLVVRSMCAVFDRYFEPEGGRHSKAL